MPRYTNAVGVVVDIPGELADRLGGYTPVEAGAVPPAGDEQTEAAVTAWLAAEDAYRADVSAWLVAEDAHRAEVHQKGADYTGRAGRK